MIAFSFNISFFLWTAFASLLGCTQTHESDKNDTQESHTGWPVSIDKSSIIVGCKDSIFIFSFKKALSGESDSDLLCKYTIKKSSGQLDLVKKVPLYNISNNTAMKGGPNCHLYWAATTQKPNEAGAIDAYSIAARNAKSRKPVLYIFDAQDFRITDSVYYSSSVSKNYSGSFSSQFLQPSNKRMYFVDVSDGIKTDSTYTREIGQQKITTSITETLLIPFTFKGKLESRHSVIRFVSSIPDTTKENIGKGGQLQTGGVFQTLFNLRPDEVKILYETENYLFLAFDKRFLKNEDFTNAPVPSQHLKNGTVKINNITVSLRGIVDNNELENATTHYRFLVALNKENNRIVNVFPFSYCKGGKVIKSANKETHVNGLNFESLYVDSDTSIWYSFSSLSKFNAGNGHKDPNDSLFTVVLKFTSSFGNPKFFYIPYKKHQFVDVKHASQELSNWGSSEVPADIECFKANFDYLNNDIIAISEVDGGVLVLYDNGGKTNMLDFLKN